jgi:hypothetical protein
MLDHESRIDILGITCARDADRPSQWYFFPGPPRISRDADGPMFDLYTFRKGGAAGTTVAGGFLNMVVDVGIGPLFDRVERRLKEQYGDDVTLTAVPFSKGAVRLIGLGEDSAAGSGDATAAGGPVVATGTRFIESVLGSSTPSLDRDNRAIFSLSLNELGVGFFLAVLSGDAAGRPLGVTYDLKYVDLLPAYDLEIEIDLGLSYDFMQTRFNVATLFFKADIDNIVEELTRRESIKIKESARTLELSDPAAIRERQTRIDQLVKDLASGALFQPSLVPGQPKAGTTSLTAQDPTSAIPDTPVSGGSAAAQGLAGGVSGGVAGGQADAHGLAADPSRLGQVAADPAAGGQGGTGTGGTGGEQGSGGTSAADLWNRLGRPQAAFTMRRVSQQERRTISYHLSQATAQEQTASPQGFLSFLASPVEMARRVHQIDLNHPFLQRIAINVSARDVDFAAQGVAQLTVELRYGRRPDGSGPKDTASVILRAPEDNLDVEFFLDSRRTLSYEYRLVIDYRQGFGLGVSATHVEGPWTTTELRSLAVHPSWLGLMVPVRVRLATNTPADVVEARVVVQYQRLDRGINASTELRLTPDQREQELALRLVEAGDQVHFRPTVIYADGSEEKLPELVRPDTREGGAADVAMIAVPRGGFVSGDLVLIDALGELSSTVVDLEVRQNAALVEARSIDVTAAGARQLWSVRLADRNQPARLRHRERRFFRDGGAEQGDWVEGTSTNIVAGFPAEGVLTVAIHYLGPPPSQLGLVAMVLELTYTDPGGNTDFDQSESLLFTDDTASQAQEWRVRLADRSARSYTWSLRLLRDDGTELATQPITDRRDLLLLRAPTG